LFLVAQRSNPGFSRRSLADFVALSPLGFAERYATGVANGLTEFTRGEMDCFASLIRNKLIPH
jgi:hypothetical protein